MKKDPQTNLIAALLLLNTLSIIGILLVGMKRNEPLTTSVVSQPRAVTKGVPVADDSAAKSAALEKKVDDFILWYDLSQPGTSIREWRHYSYSTPSIPFIFSMMLPKSSVESDGRESRDTITSFDVNPSNPGRLAKVTLKVSQNQKPISCVGDNTPGHDTSRVTINGKKFCRISSGDCGAGNCGYTEDYIYQQGGYTLTLTTEEYGSTCAAYDNAEDCERFPSAILYNVVNSMKIE